MPYPLPFSVATRLRRLLDSEAQMALVLGSGFNHVLEKVQIRRRIPYSRIPGFPKPGVTGHAGELISGLMGRFPVLILSGRSHFYEGHSLADVTFPIRVLAELGIEKLLLTNAAGGIHRRLKPGGFMILSDHINAIGTNPLRGPMVAGCERFVDLSDAYDPQLRRLLQRAAKRERIPVHSGVYIAVSGPSYETPAEIRAFAKLGADAVGMSTVPEVIVARQCGIRVAALSCITNFAAGRSRRKITHAEVLETGERNKSASARLITVFVQLCGKDSLRNGSEVVSCEPEKW